MYHAVGQVYPTHGLSPLGPQIILWGAPFSRTLVQAHVAKKGWQAWACLPPEAMLPPGPPFSAIPLATL